MDMMDLLTNPKVLDMTSIARTRDLSKLRHYAQHVERPPKRIYMFHILALSNLEPIHMLLNDYETLDFIYLKDTN